MLAPACLAPPRKTVMVASDYSRFTVVELERLAKQGDPQAQGWLGRRLYFGEGCPRDHDRGLEWIKKAADNGHSDAQFILGDIAYGMEEREEAVRWWMLAGTAKHPKALFWLGVLCLEGTPPDHGQAALYFDEAAEKGNEEAMTALGRLYQAGGGPVKQSYSRALKWFKKAAAQGDALAMRHLAVLYREGLGTDADEAKATECLRKAEIIEAREALWAGPDAGKPDRSGNGSG